MLLAYQQAPAGIIPEPPGNIAGAAAACRATTSATSTPTAASRAPIVGGARTQVRRRKVNPVADSASAMAQKAARARMHGIKKVVFKKSPGGGRSGRAGGRVASETRVDRSSPPATAATERSSSSSSSSAVRTQLTFSDK